MADTTGTKTCAIVLHFRTEMYTTRCMDSLVAEGLRRIILVDNSEDGGASIARMESSLKHWRDSGISLQVISRGVNLGFAAAVNWGVKLAATEGAEAVLLMNSDATFEPGAFSLMYSALSGADIVVPAYRDTNGKISPSFLYYDRATGAVSRRPFLFGDTFFTGCCVLGRARVLEEFPYDEDFFFYGEDVELSHRLRRAGCREMLRQNAIVHHAGAGSAGNGSLFYEYHINRGHLLLAGKLADGLFFRVVFMTGRLIFLPARALIRMFRQRSLVPVTAFLLAIYDTAYKKKRTISPGTLFVSKGPQRSTTTKFE